MCRVAAFGDRGDPRRSLLSVSHPRARRLRPWRNSGRAGGHLRHGCEGLFVGARVGTRLLYRGVVEWEARLPSSTSSWIGTRRARHDADEAGRVSGDPRFSSYVAPDARTPPECHRRCDRPLGERQRAGAGLDRACNERLAAADGETSGQLSLTMQSFSHCVMSRLPVPLSSWV